MMSLFHFASYQIGDIVKEKPNNNNHTDNEIDSIVHYVIETWSTVIVKLVTDSETVIRRHELFKWHIRSNKQWTIIFCCQLIAETIERWWSYVILSVNNPQLSIEPYKTCTTYKSITFNELQQATTTKIAWKIKGWKCRATEWYLNHTIYHLLHKVLLQFFLDHIFSGISKIFI